jgi:hypothetical protein
MKASKSLIRCGVTAVLSLALALLWACSQPNYYSYPQEAAPTAAPSPSPNPPGY